MTVLAEGIRRGASINHIFYEIVCLNINIILAKSVGTVTISHRMPYQPSSHNVDQLKKIIITFIYPRQCL